MYAGVQAWNNLPDNLAILNLTYDFLTIKRNFDSFKHKLLLKIIIN